jgi:hypothetical protein
VDASDGAYYMRGTMRLLLLLSAFLTALVGVGAPASAATRSACEVTASVPVSGQRATIAATVALERDFGHPDPAVRVVVMFDAAPHRGFPLYADRLLI